jgi:hypothetical protein
VSDDAKAEELLRALREAKKGRAAKDLGSGIGVGSSVAGQTVKP